MHVNTIHTMYFYSKSEIKINSLYSDSLYSSMFCINTQEVSFKDANRLPACPEHSCWLSAFLVLVAHCCFYRKWFPADKPKTAFKETMPHYILPVKYFHLFYFSLIGAKVLKMFHLFCVLLFIFLND